MGMFNGLDAIQGKRLYGLMSAACGSAFMLYGWDAGVLGGIQETDQFQSAIGNPEGDFVSQELDMIHGTPTDNAKSRSSPSLLRSTI